MEHEVYKSMETRFFQAGLDLAFSVLLSGSTDSRWVFQVHDHTPNQEYKVAYEGNLQETIELILLSKVLKAQLQAMDKKEPVVAEMQVELFDASTRSKKAAFEQSFQYPKAEDRALCDLCGEPTDAVSPHTHCVQQEEYLADRS